MGRDTNTATDSGTDYEQRVEEYRERWESRSPQIQRTIDKLAQTDVVGGASELAPTCHEAGIPYHQGHYVLETYPELIRYRKEEFTDQPPDSGAIKQASAGGLAKKIGGGMIQASQRLPNGSCKHILAEFLTAVKSIPDTVLQRLLGDGND